MPTGYSEVVFGELFRATGWARDEVVVANKLWWEFWPEQDAVAELDGSLARMGLDHIDLIYTMQPPDGLPITDLVAQVAGLVSSGRARAWGIGNWHAEPLAEAVQAARALGVLLPVAAQLPYSLVRPDWVRGSGDGRRAGRRRHRPGGLVRARRRNADRQVPRRRLRSRHVDEPHPGHRRW